MADGVLKIGNLIMINVDLDPANFEVHARHIDFRAQKGQFGLIIDKNIKNTRYKVLLNTGTWAEVTTGDLDRNDVEILAT